MFNNKLKEASKTMIAEGVHPKYVKRTVQELRDHFNDLKDNLIRSGVGEAEAAREAEEKIGNLHNIAIESVNKKELRSWVSLHPKTTFLAGPFLSFTLAIATWIALLTTVISLSDAEQLATYPHPGWFVAFANTMVFTNMYLMPSLLAVFFVYLSRDRMVPTRLVVLSVFIVGLLSSLMTWRTHFPQSLGEMSSLSANLNFLGFLPRIPIREEFEYSYSFSLLTESLFRMTLAFGAAAAVWWRFQKESWLEGRQGEQAG